MLLSLFRGERVKLDSAVFSCSCPCYGERESRFIQQSSHDLVPVDDVKVFSRSFPCYRGERVKLDATVFSGLGKVLELHFLKDTCMNIQHPAMCTS